MKPSTIAIDDEPQPQLVATEDRDIPVYSWPAPDNSRGVLQILHGLSEHAGRYARFAAAANAQGFTVIAHDHRGHGPMCAPDQLGHFADREGWAKVIADVNAVRTAIRQRYDGQPLVLFGHSMGSYIAQSYVIHHEDVVDGLILSGSTLPKLNEVRLGRALAWMFSRVRGPASSGTMMDRLSFGKFNERFQPTRTQFDWLSRDDDEVDRYIADPLCGATASNQLWHDLLGGILEVGRTESLALIAKNLPLLLLGGELDPVGGKQGLGRLVERYRGAGLEDVTLNLYESCRHEMLNEINRDAVMADVLSWMAERF